MSPPPTDNNPPPPTQMPHSTTWPPTDYREWVHSQIANKLFLRLTAIGVGTLVAIATAYIGINTWVLKTSQTEIARTVEQKVDPKIRTQVLANLLDRTVLLADARKQIEGLLPGEVEHAIDEVMTSSEFQTKIRDDLAELFNQTGGPQDIILDAALRRAKDQRESDSIRAVALQIYSLLHAGQRATHPIEPMRQKYVEILETEHAIRRISPKLLTVILETYPLGEYEGPEEAHECKEHKGLCEDWDIRAIDAVLNLLKIDTNRILNRALVEQLFRKS